MSTARYPIRTRCVAEHDVGLWHCDAHASGSTVPAKIAATDGKNLVMDVQGVTIAPIRARESDVLVSFHTRLGLTK